jgi:redox-sensitive bicupin YhaK (pirin superfamily)
VGILGGIEGETAMMTLRPATDRGHADHGWLDSHHTFSFADYQDPEHMGFRNLRVINEDRVAPGQGFGSHPHRDMEIVSYVLDGSIAHKDSMGTGSTIRPGDVQRMTAGRGVVHSEFNASPSERAHFLQIWILPAKPGLDPSYEQKTFTGETKRGALKLVGSPDGADDSVTLHADARLYAGLFREGERASLALPAGRNAWVQVARGTLRVNGQPMNAGDGAALSSEPHVTLEGTTSNDAEVLVFDLP